MRKVLGFIFLLMVFLLGGENSELKTADKLSKKANELTRQEKHKDAVIQNLKALDIYQRLSKEKKIAATLLQMGLNYNRLGDYENSRLSYQRSLKIYKQLGDKPHMTQALNNLGALFGEQGQFDRELEHYFQALELNRDTQNNIELTMILNNIGIVYAEYKKHDEALKYYNQSLNLSRKLKDKEGIALTLNNIGSIYLEQKKLELALRYYQESLDLSRKLKDKLLLSTVLNSMGSYYLEKKDYPETEKYFLEALDISQNTDSKLEIASNTEALAYLYGLWGKVEKAEELYQQAILLAKELNARTVLMDAYEGMVKMYRKTNCPKAIDLLHKQLEASEAIQDDMNTLQITSLENRLEMERSKSEIKLLKQQKRIDELNINRQQLVRRAFLGGIVLLLLMLSLLFNRFRLKKRANLHLAQANALIEEKNRNIMDSINYAFYIQQAILPLEEKIMEYLPQNFIIYHPKDVVAGDFYWINHVEEHTIIVVADCTGHGVPGAFMSMIGSMILNQLIIEKQLTDPSAILTQLNQKIRTALKQQEGGLRSQDGMDAAICIIGPDHMQFAGARRPLYEVNTEGELLETKGDRLSIGGKQAKKSRTFTTHTLPLNPESTYYMCSDGFADQANGEGKKFGTKQLKQILTEIASQSMEEQEKTLNRAFFAHQDNEEQRDDVTLIGFRIPKK